MLISIHPFNKERNQVLVGVKMCFYKVYVVDLMYINWKLSVGTFHRLTGTVLIPTLCLFSLSIEGSSLLHGGENGLWEFNHKLVFEYNEKVILVLQFAFQNIHC